MYLYNNKMMEINKLFWIKIMGIYLTIMEIYISINKIIGISDLSLRIKYNL